MIATSMSIARPIVARAARTGLCKHAPVAISRPLAVRVRAYKDDAANKETPANEEQAVVKQQQQGPAHLARTSHPAMRLPSLFNEMQRELDAMTRMFGLPSMLDDDLFRPLSRTPLMHMELPSLPTMRLATDIEEDDKAITIKADCPGMSKSDLKLQVMDNTLTISGERKEEKREGEEGKSPVRYERSYGSFSRSFTLPPNVDVEGISATADKGVLTVVLPKVPEEKPQPKEIPVN